MWPMDVSRLCSDAGLLVTNTNSRQDDSWTENRDLITLAYIQANQKVDVNEVKNHTIVNSKLETPQSRPCTAVYRHQQHEKDEASKLKLKIDRGEKKRVKNSFFMANGLLYF